MRLWLSSWAERLRASLFFIPLGAVGAAVVLAVIGLNIDRQLSDDPDLPLGLASTVDSARAVLSTVASATVTVAAIAFSVSLLVIQQASSQYSPRVIHGLFRDPFNKRVMGLVVGTFTYCLLVLRSVRAAIGESGEPVIPHLSVALAVVLGIGSVLAIVAFIDHSAHSMDVSEILEDVSRAAVDQLEATWAPAASDRDEELPADAGADADDDATTVRFARSGWVQQIDIEGLLSAVPARTNLRLETGPGRYAIRGAPLCTLAGAGLDEVDDLDVLEARVRSAIGMGDTRTMQQDASFSVRQLADVALKALSPGINDPTTAQDAIFHVGNVLGEMLRRDPPSAVHRDDDGRTVILAEQPSHDELVGLAFDEIRRAAATQPTVCIYLLESFSLLCDSLSSLDLDGRAEALRRQAQLVVEGAEAEGGLDHDIELVRAAYDKRFGPSRAR